MYISQIVDAIVMHSIGKDFEEFEEPDGTVVRQVVLSQDGDIYHTVAGTFEASVTIGGEGCPTRTAAGDSEGLTVYVVAITPLDSQAAAATNDDGNPFGNVGAKMVAVHYVQDRWDPETDGPIPVDRWNANVARWAAKKASHLTF